MERERRRTVHQLDSPYTTVQWPHISQDDQDVILDLLCNLLSPVGNHRKCHVQQSRGRRRKRKDQCGAIKGEAARPPAPEVAQHIDVGLASISRHLITLSSKASPTIAKEDTPSRLVTSASADKGQSESHYSVIFVARSGMAPAFISHFPEMVAAASRTCPPGQDIKLVGFSKPCADRLSTCLGIPRVSSLALHADMSQGDALVDFVKNKVPPIEIPWVRHAKCPRYQETKITAVNISVGMKRQKMMPS